MVKPKVVYLGNCQAEAMASIAIFFGLDQNPVTLPPIWTLTDNDRAKIEGAYKEADYIFLQRVDGSFPVTFVKSEYVRNLVPRTPVITWPNIYFDGYFPGIRYLYGPKGKIVGPLSDYHFDWIIETFRKKLALEETQEYLINIFNEKYATPAEDSIRNLIAREKDTDAKISDYIQTYFRHEKLFYTMNHPATIVIVEMLRRLHNVVNLRFLETSLDTFPYHLNSIDIGCLPIFNSKYHPTFQTQELIKGLKISPDGTTPLQDQPAYYKLQELIRIYYSIYSSHFDLFQTV